MAETGIREKSEKLTNTVHGLLASLEKGKVEEAGPLLLELEALVAGLRGSLGGIAGGETSPAAQLQRIRELQSQIEAKDALIARYKATGLDILHAAVVEKAAVADAAGLNAVDVACATCGSAILRVGVGAWTEASMELPCPRQKKDLATTGEKMATELLTRFWAVPGVFDYENIGFSRSVDGLKFLLCADCEVGPVGYQDPASEKSFLAVDRVKHAEKD